MKRGFILIETIVYVVLVALVVAAAVGMFVAVARTYRALKSDRAVANASMVALERLVRETRGATGIDQAQSTLDAHPGRLTLNTLDDAGLPTTTEFYLAGQVLHLRLDGVEQGPLVPAAVRVTNLVYRLVTSGQSKTLKVELGLESGSGDTLVTKNFYSTIVLRGSYPL